MRENILQAQKKPPTLNYGILILQCKTNLGKVWKRFIPNQPAHSFMKSARLYLEQERSVLAIYIHPMTPKPA